MGRHLAIGVLTGVLSLGAVLDAVAIPLDPIVRTRGGQLGSIPITFLGQTFDFYPDSSDATFPDLPPDFADDCETGISEGEEGVPDGLASVTCEFENHTPFAITSLNFTFDIPGVPPPLNEFFTLDPDDFFSTESITQVGALFAGGGGIPGCDVFEGESCLAPFHFLVDFYGFPQGTRLTMTADVAADAVPEPATLTLIGTGLVLVAGRFRRRRR